MNHENHYTDAVGLASGLLGYVISKLTTPIISSESFPSLVEIAHSVSLAVICAAAGFFTTLACKRIVKYFNKKKES
jgi:hypothetical protein